MAEISAVKEQVEQDEVGVEVPINQKSGEPYLGADGEPSTVTVLGSESKRYRAAYDSNMRKLQRKRSFKLSPEDIRENRISLAASVLTDWRGWESGGKPLERTPENVKLLLGYEHILEQVEAGITGHADFFGKPS